ncbi:MAG: hypothetical protein U1G07_00095 [Verrucomicrobiota bacterium]
MFCPAAIPDGESVEARFGVVLHPFRRWRMDQYTPFRNFKVSALPAGIQPLVARAAEATPSISSFPNTPSPLWPPANWKRRLGVPVMGIELPRLPDRLYGLVGSLTQRRRRCSGL